MCGLALKHSAKPINMRPHILKLIMNHILGGADACFELKSSAEPMVYIWLFCFPVSSFGRLKKACLRHYFSIIEIQTIEVVLPPRTSLEASELVSFFSK